MTVTAGSLDDPSWFRPRMSVFTACARPWVQIAEDIPGFPGMPDRVPEA